MKNKYIDIIEQTHEWPQSEFSLEDGELLFHDVYLMDLIKRYGTPLKLTYLPKISSQIQKTKMWFKVAMVKANYNANYNLGVNYNTRANEVIKRMNALGTSAADNKKYELLRTEQIKFYSLAKPYFEKCEVISPGKEESVARMIKAINAALSNK